jgi:chemotaxis protein CheD
MMVSCAAEETSTDTTVRMGQIVIAREPLRLTSILGSCVSVSLYHSRLRLGAMGHIVLPDSAGRTSLPGKCADTAIPHMLRQLQQHGASPAGLVVKLAGGSRMFAASGPLQIGEANVEAVTRALRAAGLAITAADLGGTKGRRITLDCSSGKLIVEIIGQPARVL